MKKKFKSMIYVKHSRITTYRFGHIYLVVSSYNGQSNVWFIHNIIVWVKGNAAPSGLGEFTPARRHQRRRVQGDRRLGFFFQDQGRAQRGPYTCRRDVRRPVSGDSQTRTAPTCIRDTKIVYYLRIHRPESNLYILHE